MNLVATNGILAPVIVLIAWTLVMWIWMYATRLPAIGKMKVTMDPNAVSGDQMAQLPASVRWKADNYNHLLDEPTLFYALAISLALLGEGDGVNLVLAWAYVGLRILHSLVQALINIIEVRFLIFVLSSFVLFAMTFNALLAVMG